MPQYVFSLITADQDAGEVGTVDTATFTDALRLLSGRLTAKRGDRLELGVTGFPPARYDFVGSIPGAAVWKAAGTVAIAA